MVGIGTVLQDNPYLNTRLGDREGRDATRVIIDTSARISLESNVLNMKSSAKTIIVTSELASKQKLQELEDKGAEIIMTPLINAQVDLKYLMKALGERKIDSILLEGGSEINYSAIEADLVDKMITFIAPKLIGGREAKTSVGGLGRALMKDAVTLKNIEVHRFDDDIMIEAYLRRE
jgi:diaminohydroxyphosphoribosylaminopyrimidine deaminase/5-amino-6-(5-phosphoribosylamino)uracil reductase